eukprot:8829360-Ditylum_brightwellii.AAC.1
MIEKVVQSTKSDHQKYDKCSDAFKHGVHYVSMSKFGGKERYFVVYGWFLDFEKNKISLTKDFMESLKDNTPTVIADRMRNNLVQVIKNVQKNYANTSTKEDGELKFEAKLGNGAT